MVCWRTSGLFNPLHNLDSTRDTGHVSHMIREIVKLRRPDDSQNVIIKVLQGYSPIIDYHHNKTSQTQVCHNFSCASSSKNKNKNGRCVDTEGEATHKHPNQTRYLLQAGGISKALVHLPSSTVCPHFARRFPVPALRCNRFSRSMQYNCKIVSATDIHGTLSACQSWKCCPACPRPQSRAA